MTITPVYPAHIPPTACSQTPTRTLGADFSNSTTGDACTPCGRGSYAHSGWSTCELCSAGKYAPGVGAAECLVCEPGKSAAVGASLCQSCAPGSASPNGAPCHACAAGEWSAEGAMSCQSCAAGTYSRQRAASCEPCGRTDMAQRTALTIDEFGNDMPAGINCSGGVAQGVLFGHWAEWPLREGGTTDALVGNRSETAAATRVWECEPLAACLGGWNSSCREGHTDHLCAGCEDGWYFGAANLCERRASGREPSLTTAGLIIFGLMLIPVVIAAMAVACMWFTSRPRPLPPRPPWETDAEGEESDEPAEVPQAAMGERNAERYHVWVHREVDEQLVPFQLGRHLAEELRRFGADARPEADDSMSRDDSMKAALKSRWGGIGVLARQQSCSLWKGAGLAAASAAASVRKEHATQLEGAEMCIFLLSDRFMTDSRSLALMRRAVELRKKVLLVNMPGARYGPERNLPFPENAFNPACTPYRPELKPAFIDICVTWELEYAHVCMSEVLERVGAHLELVLGKPVLDVPAGVASLAKAEQDELRKALAKQPSDVTLEWDWEEKVFDVFLSHKVTDAKDVVLTWYQALDALGFSTFIDRFCLDSVEKIPQYVEQTATVVIAVTSNLWQSYWSAVELCTAVELHRDGKVNILLVPVQGERYGTSLTQEQRRTGVLRRGKSTFSLMGPDAKDKDQQGGGQLDFPTPGIMMGRFERWFPDLDPLVREGIESLYGGGEYTQSRLVKHTLTHYKSFERLLVARIGVRIQRRLELEAHLAAGGATPEQEAVELAMLVDEANALHAMLDTPSRFSLRAQRLQKALSGHVDHEETLLVSETVAKTPANEQELASPRSFKRPKMGDWASVAAEGRQIPKSKWARTLSFLANKAEALTGLDIDRDGDVGQLGKSSNESSPRPTSAPSTPAWGWSRRGSKPDLSIRTSHASCAEAAVKPGCTRGTGQSSARTEEAGGAPSGSTDTVVLKTYTYQEFLPIVRALRALTRNEHTHVDKLGSVLEMWQTWPCGAQTLGPADRRSSGPLLLTRSVLTLGQTSCHWQRPGRSARCDGGIGEATQGGVDALTVLLANQYLPA